MSTSSKFILKMSKEADLKVIFDCPLEEVTCCCETHFIFCLNSGEEREISVSYDCSMGDMNELEGKLIRALEGRSEYYPVDGLSLGYWRNKWACDDVLESTIYPSTTHYTALEYGCHAALFLYSQGNKFFWEFSPMFPIMFSAKEDDEGNYPAFCEFMKSYKPHCIIPTDRDTLRRMLAEVKLLIDMILVNTDGKTRNED